MIAKLAPFRRVSLALVCLALLATFFLALPAQATRSGHEFTYYDDAAHDNVVGFQVWCSNGSHSGWGRTTPYAVIGPSGC